MVTQKRNAEEMTGINNVAYDLMTVLTNKLEAIAVMEQYKQDAQGDQDVLQCFEQIQERDRKDVDKLKELVVSRLGQK
ncbi:MAG: hypothetical protein H0U67_08960 [Gemmatimonadetes bacterium]|nr:hypothetical protein [Gemmatimonadota bacterium]